MSDISIGFLSSSKSKFRDLVRDFWLGKTSGKSNPSLTSGLKNPEILKLIVLVDSLYLKFGEKAQMPKLSQVEDKFLMYTVSKF